MPGTAVSPVSSRSDSPGQKFDPDPVVVRAKGTSSSSPDAYGHHQDLNIRREGWLNKLNSSSSSSLPSFSGSLNSSSATPWAPSNTGAWKLTRAVLKDGTLTISKPPSDLAVKSFDSSVPSNPSASSYANLHPSYYPQHSNPSMASVHTHKRITSSAASIGSTSTSLKHSTASLHQVNSNTGPGAANQLFFRGNEPHPDLEYERGRIVGGSEQAICHTILFGPSNSFAKTSVLLLPLLTDIVQALEVLTLYTSSASHLLSSLPQQSSSHDDDEDVSPMASATLALVSRLKLVVETMQNNFPGMLLDNSIFAALLKLVDSVSLHDYQVSTELKKSVFLKQKSMTEILSYGTHQEPIMWSGLQPNINEAVSDRLHILLLGIESQNKHHFTSPGSSTHNGPGANPPVDLHNPAPAPHAGGKYGHPNFFLHIPPDLILDLSVDIFAKQIYHFHLAFSKDWSPTSDISLLFNTRYSYNKHSPLVFDSTNIHFLGSLLIDHLFNLNHRVDNSYRGKILTYWINLGNALKNCGDMVGWLSIATVICSIPVLRLRSTWCYVSSDIRDRVTKEWAPVVFDLERRLMISDMSRKSTFHVLAPQGIGITYPKERVVPFFGDLCVKFEEGSTYKQCESRLNRIRTAFERWESYLEQIPQNDTFEPLPDAVPVIQKLLYSLLSHHYEAPVVSPESILKLSLNIEPNYFGQYLKYHYSQKSALATGSYIPVLFTILVPAYRLFPKLTLLNSTAALQGSSSKRTLRPSASRSGDSFKTQPIRIQNNGLVSSSSHPQFPTGELNIQRAINFPALPQQMLLTTGYAEIDNPARQFVMNVTGNSPLLQDIYDILNIGARIYHIGEDIVLKAFDEEAHNHFIPHQPPQAYLMESSRSNASATAVPRMTSIQLASHDPTALGLPDGSPGAAPRHRGHIINTVVKAANLERLVDILVLGVSDFSAFVNADDLARYPEQPHSDDPQAANSSASSITTSNTSATAVSNSNGPSQSTQAPVFKVDMDVHTMTFFATYRSFCSPSVLLESFRKRFVGARSAALSIVTQINNTKNLHETNSQDLTPQQTLQSSSSGNLNSDSHFPNWDVTCDADPESIDWRIVAQIQIGVLEACHLWVSQYFSDFSNDLVARDQFLDLLRSFEVELVSWKDAGVLLRDDYKYYFDTIEALHKKVRKLFIKKSYRPIDIKKLLPNFPPSSNLENLPINGDIGTLERWIDDIDSVAAEYFSTITMRDWMEAFECIETQSSDLTGFFNYKSPNASSDDDVIVLDIYGYIESFKSITDERLILSLPRPVREMFKLHNNLVHFFAFQISDPRIKREERVGHMVTILKIMGIIRSRMGSMDVFNSEGLHAAHLINEDTKSVASPLGPDQNGARNHVYPVSPHIPSFLEAAVAAAIIRPESRGFANSWIQASKELCKQFGGTFTGEITTVDSIVPDVPASILNRGSNGKPNLLTPCIGWLFERMFEVVCYIPNMAVENSKLINFDKRRYTYNLISSVLDVRPFLQTLDSKFQTSLGETPASLDFLNRIAYLVNPVKGLYHLDRRVAREAASREVKEYPRSSSKNRVFAIYVNAEIDKVKRDTRQKEALERQAKELKKANSKINKATGHLESSASSVSDRKTGKSRFGGFFKAVRPISMAFSGSFTPPAEKTIHPDDLPLIGQMGDARFKQMGSIKLIESDITHIKSVRDRTIFKITNKGTEHWFQAPTEMEAEEWVRSLDLSRKYANLLAVMSPTSSKVFGVPISIVCDREHSLIPRVVEKLLSEIEERGLREVGIYRIPGSLASVNALKAAFDSGEDVNMKDDRWHDVNTVTGCFKLYLRELPEPLLTVDLLDAFVACGQIANTPEGVNRLHQCVEKLPVPNYNLLKRLVEHLHSVTVHGDYNKMHAVNLAIVFSMSLLPSSSSTALMNTELGSMQTILKVMITSHDRIFGEDVLDDVISSEQQSQSNPELHHVQPQSYTNVPMRKATTTGTESLSDSHNPALIISSSSTPNATQVSLDENSHAQSGLASAGLPPHISSQSPVRSHSPNVEANGAGSHQLHYDNQHTFDGSNQSSEEHHSSSATPPINIARSERSTTTGLSSSYPTTGFHGSPLFQVTERFGDENGDNFDGGIPAVTTTEADSDEVTMDSLSNAMAKNMLAIPPRSNSRLTAEGRSKRFSSLILPSEFTPPIVDDDNDGTGLGLEEGIYDALGSNAYGFSSEFSADEIIAAAGSRPTSPEVASASPSHLDGVYASPALGNNSSASSPVPSGSDENVTVVGNNHNGSTNSGTHGHGHRSNNSEMSIIRETNSEEELEAEEEEGKRTKEKKEYENKKSNRDSFTEVSAY